MKSKSIIYIILLASLSAFASSFFLHALNFVTQLRFNNPILIVLLPLFGVGLSLFIKFAPNAITSGLPNLFYNTKTPLHPMLTLFQFFASIGTHLFGGSAGREGVGIQMSIGLFSFLEKWDVYFKQNREKLISMAIAAGFAAIFGTPFAAIVFSLEIYRFHYLKDKTVLLTIVLCAFVAYAVGFVIGPSHFHFLVDFTWSSEIVIYILIAGLSAGIGANFYNYGLKFYNRILSYCFPSHLQRMCIGSSLIILLVFYFKLFDYIGIGTHVIETAFTQAMNFDSFFFKCLLTIMTLALGFKGGEATPLFFMGLALSNSTAAILGYSNFALSSALGFTALFGALTATPLACAVMGGELFGYEIGFISLLSCFVARFFMLGRSVFQLKQISNL
jgi:H+/Cl- antiporter ClcA